MQQPSNYRHLVSCQRAAQVLSDYHVTHPLCCLWLQTSGRTDSLLAKHRFAAEREDQPTLQLSFDIHQTLEVFHLKG